METLPGLDSGPEVFETSDSESLENIHFKPQEIGGPDVEFRRLDSKNAFDAFEENTLEAMLDLVDFSGSLVAEKQCRASYNPRKWTETRSQRLARIAHELTEIEEDDEHEANEILKFKSILEMSMKSQGQSAYSQKFSTSFQQVEDQLVGLKSHSFDEPKDLNQLSSEFFRGDINHSNPGQILEIEKRLHGLETAIGATEFSPATNLKLHVRDLDRKVNVLYNPEYEVDTLKAKVVDLNRELEMLTKSRRMAQLTLPDAVKTKPMQDCESPINCFEKKVDIIYSKLGEIETARARLPVIIGRLKALHQTHSDLSSAVSTIGVLDFTLGSLEQDLSKWNETLNSVKTAMYQHVSAFDKRRMETESKLSALESRVDSLFESKKTF